MHGPRSRPEAPSLLGARAPSRNRVPVLIGIVAGLLLTTGTIASPGLTAAASDYAASCDARLRDAASTDATVVDVITSGTVVTVSSTASGSDWSADCGSGTVSGSTWYVITAVGGATTTSLYGKGQLYAATGLFTAVPPPSAYIEGVDVSRWQGTIDYAQVKASGRQFVIAKASEGVGFRDPSWTINRSAVPAAGLRLGGYHFARPDGNPGVDGAKAEADWFASQLQLANGMIVPALDLEVRGSQTVSQLTDWVKAWLQEVYVQTGVRPMIYVSPAFWRTYLGDTRWFADNGYKILWIAHWTTGPAPSVPGSNWGGHGWTFWQYTSSGSVPGIGGRVDLDRYNGTDMTRVTVGADFALALGGGAGAMSIEQAAQRSQTISISRTWFTLPVALAVSGLPSTIHATLSASSTTGNAVTMTVDTSTTPPGTYPYTITGTANGLSRTATGSIVVTDALPPTVAVPITTIWLGTLGSVVPVKTTWSATDPSGVASYGLERQTGGAAWVPVTLANPAVPSAMESVPVGAITTYAADATDSLGHLSAWRAGPSIRPLVTQQTSSSVKFSTGWSTVYSGKASGGSLRYATRAGSSATYTFVGRSIGWVAWRGPTSGTATVYVDGQNRGIVNLYARVYQSTPIVFAFGWTSARSHTIKIVVNGTAGHSRVDVDAFVQLSS